MPLPAWARQVAEAGEIAQEEENNCLAALLGTKVAAAPAQF